MVFTLVSESFKDNETIPARYTCEGFDMSPPLLWTQPPAGAKSLVLIVDDPDAPDPKAPKTIWTHWILYNLPPEPGSLVEGVPAKDLPPGCQQGMNDWGRPGYGGPCPPIGEHRYRHRLYALDVVLPDLKTPTRTVLDKIMEEHVIEQAQLTGLYEKARG